MSGSVSADRAAPRRGRCRRLDPKPIRWRRGAHGGGRRRRACAADRDRPAARRRRRSPRQLAELASFDWLVVTSVNGVRVVADASGSAPAGLRLAAVGPTTASALAAVAGRAVDLVPTESTRRGLGGRVPAPAVPGARGPRRTGGADRGRRLAGGRSRRRRRDRATRTVSLVADAAPSATPWPGRCRRLRLGFGGGGVGGRGAGGSGCPLVVAIGPSTGAHRDRAGLEPHAGGDPTRPRRRGGGRRAGRPSACGARATDPVASRDGAVPDRTTPSAAPHGGGA